jgi:protein ImuB
LADARALCPSLQVINEKEEAAIKILTAMAEWSIRFSPVTSFYLPDILLIEATGCTHLWKGDQHYADHIASRFRERGYRLKWAMAPTASAAMALAKFHPRAELVAAAGLLDALLPLPPECLGLDDNESISLLYRLGMRSLRDFIHLPTSVLRNRFGKQLPLRIAQMTGRTEEFINPVKPAEAFSWRLPSPEPITHRKGIEIGLDECLSGILKLLTEKGLGIRKAVFKIYTLDGREQEVGISTFRPSSNKDHLSGLFSNRLEQLLPGEGIELFLLEASITEKNPALQEKLWETSEGLQGRDISELLDRIAGRLTPASISRYVPAQHHWPERSFTRTGEHADETGNAWPENLCRPVEWLPSPEPIEVAAPIPDYPPMLFRYRQKLHRVKKAEGPERIEREWWLEAGRLRDYYIVEDEEGSRYWLFRSGHYEENERPQWFLCGYFA